MKREFSEYETWLNNFVWAVTRYCTEQQNKGVALEKLDVEKAANELQNPLYQAYEIKLDSGAIAGELNRHAGWHPYIEEYGDMNLEDQLYFDAMRWLRRHLVNNNARAEIGLAVDAVIYDTTLADIIGTLATRFGSQMSMDARRAIHHARATKAMDALDERIGYMADDMAEHLKRIGGDSEEEMTPDAALVQMKAEMQESARYMLMDMQSVNDKAFTLVDAVDKRLWERAQEWEIDSIIDTDDYYRMINEMSAAVHRVAGREE